MKKTHDLIGISLVFALIGYGLYRLTGYDFFWILPVAFVAMFAAVHLIGLVIWAFEYIGRNDDKPEKP